MARATKPLGPQEPTWPMMHSSTAAGSIPARFTASPTTRAPMSMAETVLRLPPNLAIGVRAPETMTMSSGRLSKVRLLMFLALPS